ncbi:nucleotidyltransferase domain-containing protein [Deinococcus psychrotolerans]|uniref:Nucleotidyltransferase domain-containing protein n=1 Tax=Deinococcus psychrotolerans TaxID=2489213 RepID=A0A3G8YDI2_9DEIO|nr:nucleotidyltransferase domain-containing protein [Deinococcus psychrotolerans]AZI43459.1 nucleotidyltransferase domain-containing protein [Deinococcus psychrotolerans]
MLDLAHTLAARLGQLSGVEAVTLGGSRARGNTPPDSDWDLGLYYRKEQPFDLAALNALCRELDDAGTAEATPIGGWGPWVDGGAWLTVGGQRVDFIYRELGRLERSVQDALAGHIKLHAQPGHPHGIHSHHYAAELAAGQLLFDSASRLAALKDELDGYPPALKATLIAHYDWQPDFWLYGAAKGLKRGDTHYAQGCAYQAVMALAQTLCARSETWITNEKGAVALAAGVAGAPLHFAERIGAALSPLDPSALQQLIQETNCPVSRWP